MPPKSSPANQKGTLFAFFAPKKKEDVSSISSPPASKVSKPATPAPERKESKEVPKPAQSTGSPSAEETPRVMKRLKRKPVLADSDSDEPSAFEPPSDDDSSSDSADESDASTNATDSDESEDSEPVKKKAPAKRAATKPVPSKASKPSKSVSLSTASAATTETSAVATLNSWLLPENRRDAQRRRPTDPGYDSRTVFIPPDAWKSMTPGQKQFWELKRHHMDVLIAFKTGRFYEFYDMFVFIP